MNSMTLRGNWNMLKGKVREKWGKLTDDDLEQIQGNSEQLLGKVQRAYGLSKEEATRQIASFEEDCGCDRDEQLDRDDMAIDDDQQTIGRTTRGRDVD